MLQKACRLIIGPVALVGAAEDSLVLQKVLVTHQRDLLLVLDLVELKVV